MRSESGSAAKVRSASPDDDFSNKTHDSSSEQDDEGARCSNEAFYLHWNLAFPMRNDAASLDLEELAMERPRIERFRLSIGSHSAVPPRHKASGGRNCRLYMDGSTSEIKRHPPRNPDSFLKRRKDDGTL